MNIRVNIGPSEREARKAVEHALARLIPIVDRLLITLDQLDGDTDLEPGNDDEPYLGWTGNGPYRPWNETDPNRENDDDREHDDCDLEDGHDREATNENGGDIQDEPHDDTDSGDAEPSLGRLETINQGAASYMGEGWL